jgi:hypothetical protein
MFTKARMFTNEMKRAHRAKRDLPYTDDDEYPMSYYPAKFGPSYMIDDLESYAREKEYENNVLRAILDNVDPDDVEEIVHKGVMGLFIPLEEEEPVIPTRKRNFYPYSDEPETHFGAFVPEKREYLDSYSRLVQLAKELSKSDQSSDEEYQVENNNQLDLEIKEILNKTKLKGKMTRSILVLKLEFILREKNNKLQTNAQTANKKTNEDLRHEQYLKGIINSTADNDV